MVAGLKVQEVEVTVRWHNIYLTTTIFFLCTTVVFSALFGGYYTAYLIAIFKKIIARITPNKLYDTDSTLDAFETNSTS